MKRYRALRDMPFWPKGEMKLVCVNGNLFVSKSRDSVTYYNERQTGEMVNNGWIEEVKENKVISHEQCHNGPHLIISFKHDPTDKQVNKIIESIKEIIKQ